MPDTFVLLTAMPPTTGHLELIQFANQLVEGRTHVLLNTQPHEPFPHGRRDAIEAALRRVGLGDIDVHHMHRTIAQDPATPYFWDMWKAIMEQVGFMPGDLIVASELYGIKLAEVCGGRFYPYDIDREINPVKATPVRADPIGRFTDILPEFRRHVKTTVTIFGAESTGKTTLTRQLADELDGTGLFEYARPLLEHTGADVTTESMVDIWRGQRALQIQGADVLNDRPYIIQDTDLFSTIGYWRMPHRQAELGPCPAELVGNAIGLKSDLYVLAPSNIPFEEDPLRYGGDVRESDDAYWLALLEAHGLPYVVLESSGAGERLHQAAEAIREVSARKAAALAYDRGGL